MHSANDIRRDFLDYFHRHGHQVVPSSPLVPHNDPSLLFTSAGMVQFKNVFTGAEKRPYSRAVTAQKCLRAGGKHNDLDNVGYTARHHTFFEMLGNFSFGEYFKETAIELSWRLVTEAFGIDPARLIATVYIDDDEAFALWHRIAGLPERRIIRIAGADNFWAMGDTGPCGPCSELFYDHGEDIPGGPPGSADEDGDRFVEIWNLVFMQYEQVTPDKRIDLPRPSIDTGMGLERIAAVLQGVHDNYDIDLFRHLMAATEALTGVPAEGPHCAPHKVIADHLRAASFLLADGVMPANEGRGYVLRRIMRRAMRHAHMMGCSEPLMWRLVPALVEEMGQAYPELVRAQALITETLKLEEARFKETLDRGLRLLAEETAKLAPGAPLPGEIAFRLYDTYGFPLDLTEDVLRTEGRAVAHAGFEAAMARQRAEARAAWAGSGEAATEAVWFAVREEVGATEFLGYETTACEGKVVALIVGDRRVAEAGAGAEVAVVVNQTPFYAESGGQVGDTGVLTAGPDVRVVIRDTRKKVKDLHVHFGTVAEGTLRVGDVVDLGVDGGRRAVLRANHSATHLLHNALRRRLGAHVTQKGSLVAPDRLRFDFSQPRPLSADEIDEIEAEVNRQVLCNVPVATTIMTPEEAVAHGAIALFGETYGEVVRVVAMGTDDGDRPYSVELCGGTHVRRTGDIGLFKIVSEAAVGAGVRRIEALTGETARRHLEREEALLLASAEALRTSPEELPARVQALVAERRELERALARLRRRLAVGEGGEAIREIAGIRLAARRIEGASPKELRGMADELKKRIGSGVVALVGVNGGKAALIVGVTDDLTGRIDAVALARAGAAALGGKGGGGRPDLAQAGGPDAAKAEAALAAIAETLAA